MTREPPFSLPMPLESMAPMTLHDDDAVIGLIDGMLDAVWLVDAADLRVVAANPAAGRLLGIDAGRLRGRDVVDLTATPEDLYFWREAAAGLTERIESQTYVRHRDGRAVPVLRRVSRGRLASGASVFIVVVHDRSAQCKVEQELERRVAELSATLESTTDGILVTDLAGRIRTFNRRFAAMWALTDDVLTRHDDDLVLAAMQRAVVDPAGYMRRLSQIDIDGPDETTDVLTLSSGRVLERVTLPQKSHGAAIGRVYSFRDITERIEASQRIATLSHTDPLTGLANRRALADRVEFSIAMARRDDSQFAVLFANLDRFKHVNDSLGHGLGDRVLIDVAERLRACLRGVDTVARLGGDEFLILAHQADATGAEVAARRVMEAMEKPFTQGGLSFTLTASLGIALYPRDGADLDELVSNADNAMNEVKRGGRATHRFHHAGDAIANAVDLRSRMTLDHAMRRTLASGGFRLHYQPQVDMATGEVRGAEALIRWTDPVLGEISPGEFIPVAEESGFIIPIGDWVLREAVRQAARWQACGLRLIASVNVSAVQFQQPGFVDSVADALRESGLAPQWLELELTESILIQNAQDALLRLQALSELGVKLAIDDFGTGYSSLGYLKRFPIGRLKIDRSFVRGLPSDESDKGIVSAILTLGRALHLQVIAEGVETEEQRAFLTGAGCDEYQGFLYAPALDPVAFEARLRTTPIPSA